MKLLTTLLILLLTACSATPVDDTLKGLQLDTPSIIDSTILTSGADITLVGENGNVNLMNIEGDVVFDTTIPSGDRISDLDKTYYVTSTTCVFRWFTNAEHTNTAGVNITDNPGKGIRIEWTEGLTEEE